MPVAGQPEVVGTIGDIYGNLRFAAQRYQCGIFLFCTGSYYIGFAVIGDNGVILPGNAGILFGKDIAGSVSGNSHAPLGYSGKIRRITAGYILREGASDKA